MKSRGEIKMTKVTGWTLNSEVPTGRTTEIEWNNKKIPASIKEFNFLHLDSLRHPGLTPTITIYDTSEWGAWEQLREKLQGEGK